MPSALKIGAVLSAAALVYSAAALAEPVTKADLAGKKICWNDGITTFGKDGSFHSTRFSDGTWSLTGDQLVMRGTHAGFTATITKRNKTFHVFGHVAGNDAEPYGTRGKYCK
ncbi:MAG TPA: hypothetical protein VGL12_08865 [Roseiarcus sp.]